MIDKYPPETETASATRVETPVHILIIEESAEVRADIRRMLLPGSDCRYRITEAQSGADGLRACREAAGDSLPDCVLIGYHLPDMDAAEVLAQLRNQSELPPYPVVVLTGPNSRVGNRILRAGAQEYIGTSWLTPETLIRVIEDAIERFNLIAERFGDAVPLFDEIGNVRGATGVFTAITDRKRAEEARQEITEKYERQARVFDATLSAITDFAYIFDLEGTDRRNNTARCTDRKRRTAPNATAARRRS